MKSRGLVHFGFILFLTSGGLFFLFKLMNAEASRDLSPARVVPGSVQDTPGGWHNLGLYGARIAAEHGIIIDASSNALYACTGGVYGLYKRENNEDQWRPLTGTLGGCSSSAFDAVNSRLYWAHGTHVSASNDGGLNWQRIFTVPESLDGFYEYAAHFVALDPNDPATVFIGTDPGKIFRSSDEGRSWQQAQLSPNGSTFTDTVDAGVFSIAVDPTEGSFVYAATGVSQPGATGRGIYRSTDGGQTFIRIVTDTLGAEIGVNVNANGTVFASYDGSIWRSWDDGDTWEDISPAPGGASIFSFHPTLTETVWVYAFRSDDEGDTWQPTGVSAPVVHPVTTSLMYRNTPYGAAKSDDGGATWSDLNQGLEEISVLRIAVDPHDHRRYFVIASGGVGYTEDDSQNWTFPVLAEDFRDVVIDPSDPDVIYVTGDGFNFVFKSVDGGATWTSTEIRDDLSLHVRLNRLVLDPANTQTGYLAIDTNGPPVAGHWGGIYKTTDGGASWISTTLRDVPANTALLVTDTGRVYAGAINTWNDDQIGGVYRSDDEGQTWARSGLTGTAIADLEVDPRFPDHLYAGSQGEGIYKSEDGGASWQQRFPYGWIWDIALDPENPDIVYAIVDADIYRSIDAGNSWDILYQRRETDGFPFVLHVPWLPPAPVPSLTATVVNSTSVRLSWLNPSDSDFAGTLVRYMTSTFPTRYDEGVVVTDQVGAPGSTGLFTHTGTFSDTTLYYSAFAYDVDGYYALPNQISVTLGNSAMMRPFTQHTSQAQTSSQSTLYLGNTRGLYHRTFEGASTTYLPVISRRE